MNVRQNTSLAVSECVCGGEQSQARLQVTACTSSGRREQQNLPFGGTMGFRPPAGGSAAVSVIQTPLSAKNEDVMETEGNASHVI